MGYSGILGSKSAKTFRMGLKSALFCERYHEERGSPTLFHAFKLTPAALCCIEADLSPVSYHREFFLELNDKLCFSELFLCLLQFPLQRRLHKGALSTIRNSTPPSRNGYFKC